VVQSTEFAGFCVIAAMILLANDPSDWSDHQKDKSGKDARRMNFPIQSPALGYGIGQKECHQFARRLLYRQGLCRREESKNK